MSAAKAKSKKAAAPAKKGAAKPTAKPVKAAARKAAPAKAAKPVKAPAKAVKPAKPAPKTAAKPARRPAAKPAAKATAKPAAKAAPKAAAKAAARPVPAKAAARPAAPPAPISVRKEATPMKSAAVAVKPAPTPRTKPAAGITSYLLGFSPYVPAKGEEYMNPQQKEHFRAILLAWKRELMEEVDRTKNHMQEEASNPPDPTDRATQEEEFSLELRARDRERKLIKKIEEALDRLGTDEFGYCEACGVEIGVKRLEARPTATLCIDCKTLDELKEKQLGL